jgi:hypothetical protein
MPKQIDVKLVGIFREFSGNDSGNDVEIDGRIFGVTFNENPYEEKSQSDIFAFPHGPIRISQGEMVPIDMGSTEFFLSTPSTEPPRVNGVFLLFGGELNNSLGSGFGTISTFDITQPDVEQRHSVEIGSDNLKIRLDFVLTERFVW